MINTLEELREEVAKLKALLDDPRPGLMYWAELYHERMTAINEFWTRKAK